MERLLALSMKYNIGTETMINFLKGNGFVGELTLTSKIETKFTELIEKEFHKDRQEKMIAELFTLPETYNDKMYKEIKKIRINQTKRICIEPRQEITYKEIFGQCFWGCTEINCTDPYIREKHQFQNLRQLIFMIKEFTLNPIKFNLNTSYDLKNNQSKEYIESNLEKLRVEYSEIDFTFTLDEDKYHHDRYIYIDNRYIIDLTRGLDIFENYNNSHNYISKKCTIFITRIT